MQPYPDKAAFRESLHSTYRVQAGAAVVSLELVELNEGHSSPRNEQFSLVFRGPGETPLQQRIHRVEHEQLGAFDLFLVPIRRDNAGLYYEAVFNRLIEQQS